MESVLIMDNDSGYVSHNHESNLDCLSENATKSYSENDIYICEDALLEKPLVKNVENCDHFESVDSVINCSQESIKTEFSGFEDSDQSDTSLVIPVSKQIVWNTKERKESSSGSSISFSKNVNKVLANVTNTYDKNVNQTVIKSVAPDHDKENICPLKTPEKRYENRMTSDVSPDLFFEEEEALNVVMPIKRKSSVKKDSPEDDKLLERVKNSLKGVYPPPSVTIIQMSVIQMLDKIQENKHLFWNSDSSVTGASTEKSLLITDKSECIHTKWPEILNFRYHGLHYNRNNDSEEFEHLCSKYAERYVGAETQSTCTVFESNPCSSQKRKLLKPKWGAKSPGRRLSHLARRRITFSSSNLQASSSSAILGSRARQILVDARNLSMSRRSPRKTARKTPSKSPFKIRKNTPSSSAKKKLVQRFRQMSGEFKSTAGNSSSDQSGHNFKRALFNGVPESGPSQVTVEIKSTRRALFPSPLKHSPQKKSPFKFGALEKKRKRNDDDEGNPSKFIRSLSMDVQQMRPESKSVFSRTLSETITTRGKQEELSEQHKKKLQLAVHESLRLQNVTPSHPQYKVFASVLARVTRRFLPNLRVEGRTSEKMFAIAKHHAHAVVKGKMVDEIINEYRKNKVKNQKPHGYIGIEEFNNLNNRSENYADKENILQDKINIIESIEKRREHSDSKSRLFIQNRIDRIKKVISFEEKKT
jgi:hypothetical protein